MTRETLVALLTYSFGGIQVGKPCRTKVLYRWIRAVGGLPYRPLFYGGRHARHRHRQLDAERCTDQRLAGSEAPCVAGAGGISRGRMTRAKTLLGAQGLQIHGGSVRDERRSRPENAV